MASNSAAVSKLVTVNGCTFHVEQWHEEQAQATLVLLHGFTGSTATWHEVVPNLKTNKRIVAIDLIGHGQTMSPEDVSFYSMDAQISMLHMLFQQLQLKNVTLLGYSMGGRVALSYATKYPQAIEQLLLESASPGLVDQNARAERKLADDTLANKIEQNGLEVFVNHWENIPLFASQKSLSEEKKHAIRQERMQQNARGLANSLRGMGTGVMPELWNSLANIPMPVTLITGSMDQKFVQIAEKMLTFLKNGQHFVINENGHAIHVENPINFATIVEDTFIRN